MDRTAAESRQSLEASVPDYSKVPKEVVIYQKLVRIYCTCIMRSSNHMKQAYKTGSFSLQREVSMSCVQLLARLVDHICSSD